MTDDINMFFHWLFNHYKLNVNIKDVASYLIETNSDRKWNKCNAMFSINVILRVNKCHMVQILSRMTLKNN